MSTRYVWEKWNRGIGINLGTQYATGSRMWQDHTGTGQMFITQNYDASGFYNFQPAGSCPVGWYFVYGWNVTREAIAYLAQAECTLTWVEWAGMMELSGICRMANVATVKGDTLEGTVSSPNNAGYPQNGLSGNSWYVYQGADAIDPTGVDYVSAYAYRRRAPGWVPASGSFQRRLVVRPPVSCNCWAANILR